MKMPLLAAGVCGAAVVAVIAYAAQDRGFEGAGPPSRLAAALDTNRDGAISATELRSSSSALMTLDANGDGRLTADELRPAFGPRGPRDGGPPPSGERRGRGGDVGERGGGAPASADDLADTLMAFDRNGDGKLDRAEVPARFQGLFDRADANKDGALTRDELEQSATATAQADAGGGRRGGRDGAGFGRGRGGPMADPLLRALDADRDGTLSESEIARAADALATLDTNKDGQLSPDEIRLPAPGGREGRFR